jgi:hypothetical protein
MELNMIDNVKIKVAIADAPDFSLEKIPFSGKDKYCYMRHCRNMRITKYPDCILIMGSLAKYKNGEKAIYLDWDQIPETLDELGETIGLDLHKGKVYNLENGMTIPVEYPVSKYLQLFDYTRLPFKRVEYSTKNGLETIQYRTKSGGDYFHVYDKALEMNKANRLDDIPSNNLLRLEYRICSHRRIETIFNGDISPYDLASPKVRLILDYLFNRFYKRIEKVNRQPCLSGVEKMTPLKMTVLSSQLFREEHPKSYSCLIQQALEMGILSKQNLKKLRRSDRRRTKDFSFFDNDSLIKELNKKLQLNSVKAGMLTRIVLQMKEQGIIMKSKKEVWK